MMAAKEETRDVFALAAFSCCLPKTRVWGSRAENQGFGWAWSSLSSTSRWGCGYVYGGTASGETDQRFYASSYGRFNSPDPYQADEGGTDDVSTPQSWNKYVYVQGDPINWFDPQGLFLAAPQPSTDCPPGMNYYNGACFAAINDGSGKGMPNGGGGGGGGASGAGVPQPLDPNSQECQDLARKIANIQRDIAEMQNRIDVNPGNLPITAVGPPSASIQGHQQILAAAQANLATQLALYAQKCGGGPPPAVRVRPPVILPPGTKYPPVKKPSPITIGIGVGVGAIVVCGLLQEVCAVAAPVLVW